MKIPPPPSDPSELGTVKGEIPPPPGSPTELDEKSISEKFLDYVEENGPAIAGGIMGGSMGAVGGPPGSIAGATFGGAAGEALKRDMEYLSGKRDPSKEDMGTAAEEIASAGFAQGLAEGGVQALGAGARAFGLKYGKAVNQIGGQASRIASGVPEKYASAVLKKPSILKEALSPEAVGKAYQEFESSNGLKGLTSHFIDTTDKATASADHLQQMIFKTAKRVFKQNVLGEMAEKAASENGGKEIAARLAKETKEVPVTSQELYHASQAASHLKQMARFGEPQAQMVKASAALSQSKRLIDGELERQIPGYTALRTSKFESKARQAFESAFPLNKGGTPAVLRSWTAAVLAAKSALAGNPLGVLVAGAVSPKAQGLAIKAVDAAMGPAKEMATAGVKALAQGESDKVSIAAHGLSERARKILGYEDTNENLGSNRE